jgi:uncharacterized protein (DUF2141 family)
MISIRAIRSGLRTLIGTTALISGSVSAGDLEVTIRGIESEQGQLMVAVVNSEAAFNGETPAVLSLLIAPRQGNLSFSTDALPDGAYGIRVMHDENGNGDMDANMVGMPTEAWGFSNNAMGNFGPPTWADIRFELGGETNMTIDLNH